MASAKPVLVGSFVLGALALGVLAILIFGGMQLFTNTVRVVVFFRDSITGLGAGAPVTFQGVPIGQVERIRLHVDVLHQTNWVPVYLDLDLGRITWVNGSAGGNRADLRRAVSNGLRAQIVSQSLLSGQSSVNLDFRPDTEALLAGHADDALEIPTIPSDMQNLKDDFRSLDLREIGLKTQQVLVSMQRVLDDLDGRIGPLADGLQSTLGSTTAAVRHFQADAARTMADIDRLANESHEQITTNGKDLDQLLQTAELATNHVDALVVSLNDMTSPRGDLQASLRDLSASASSLRSLTHDLERNPLGTLLRRDKK
jgi:phospholipid/cholesterol/gamma-HCH transport system substrate-binding protein